mgnify:CR=1 FL=1
MKFTRPSVATGKRAAVCGAALALIGTAVAVGGPGATTASSHREAPLIAGDPRADNTDVYAFVSPDDADTVTLISNWIPFEEPNGGPNFYPWADDTQYNIKIDNDGDALPDLTYTWLFTTQYDGSTFLYNNGPVTSLDDENLLYFQTYDLIETVSVPGEADVSTTLLDDVRAAPSLVGPGSIPDYAPLVEQATYDLFGGAGQTYVGQADDPFFLDLRVFDLLYGGDLSEVGEDTLAGYNVNTVAIQLPKSVLAGQGDAEANPVIGVWSTTDRRSSRAANGEGDTSSEFVQVSRLGNPLVNEVVFPLALKDAFNSISPDIDATIPAAVDAVSNPILPGLIEAFYGVPAPAEPRNDLEEIFLQGVSMANSGLGGDPEVVLNVDLNGHNLNEDQAATLQPSEQLRLNMSVPTSADVNRLSLFAGQFDGFPNGRRLEDDVVDIALQTVMGAAQSGELVAALAAGDAVDRNDREFSDTFPYLALPHADSVNQGTERSPRASDFISLTPERVLDTRAASGQIGYIGDKPAAGQVVEVQVTGIGNSLVPDDALSVAVNVTTTDVDGASFVTAYDCDDPRPNASNVNTLGGPGAWSNLALVGVSEAGTICIYTLTSASLIVDLNGYVPSTSAISSTQPERLLETREEFGQTGYSGVRPAAGRTIELDVTQVGENQIADGAKAVFVNVTAIDPSADGFVTVWSCEGPLPAVSALNYDTGAVIPNLMVAPVGPDGSICLYTLASTDLAVDLLGEVPSDSDYIAAGPERILETREEFGQVGYSGSQPGAGQVVEVQVTGVGDAQVPATAASAFLNVTTTNESPLGFFTVWPCGEQQPNASSGNFRGAGKSTANFVTANIGDSGRVCIFVLEPVDLVVDLVGYFPGVGTG